MSRSDSSTFSLNYNSLAWLFPQCNCQVWNSVLDAVWEIKTTFFFSSGALHPGLYDFLKKKMSIYPGWPCSRKRSTQKCSASSRNLGNYAGMSASLCWVRIILLVLNVLSTCSLFAGTWSQLVWNFTWRMGLMKVCKLAWIDAVACLILHWTLVTRAGRSVLVFIIKLVRWSW